MQNAPRPLLYKRYNGLLLILIGAAFLRIYGLWAYMPTMDEVQFLIISQGASFAEIFSRAQAEVHPPLSWFIRHFTLMLSPDIFVQRLVSVAAGLFTILGSYHFGKASTHNKRAGLACGFMMAFIPSAVISSMGLRNYVFLMLFMVWALVFFLRWQSKGKTRDLALYTLLICCACSSHFSAFLVAAACGLTQGIRLLMARNLSVLAVFCLSYIPLLLLGAVFYHYYLAPGTTIPMWKNFMLQTGFTPAHPETGVMASFVIPLIAYFSPFLQAVHAPGFVPSALLPVAQGAVLVGAVLLMILYVIGLNLLRKAAPAAFDLTIMLWVITLGLSFADLYPFSANRHNIYLLPFFILPLAILCIRPIAKLSTSPYALRMLAIGVVLAVAIDECVIWQDEDFCLKKDDYEKAQTYLATYMTHGDVIVTGPMGAYFYLIYMHDEGRVPYNDYTDKAYYKGTTLLAPFASPYKPYSSWQPFRDDLKARLASGIVTPQRDVWFVQYGWKNQEIWTLMQCRKLQPFMEHFMSREGIVIFSVKASMLDLFLSNDEAWNYCYEDYQPLVIGTPFHAVEKPNAAK